MESATWCRTPAAASAARGLRPEVSKNSSTALSSNEGELARSTTTCAPATASSSPSPVMVLTPVLGEAATTSWSPWRRMATAFEPIRPVPPMTTIFMTALPCQYLEALRGGFSRLEISSGTGRAHVLPPAESEVLAATAGLCAIRPPRGRRGRATCRTFRALLPEHFGGEDGQRRADPGGRETSRRARDDRAGGFGTPIIQPSGGS